MQGILKTIIVFLFSLSALQSINGAEKEKPISMLFESEHINDSLYNLVELKLESSRQYTSEGHYPEAYDEIWEVLTWSDSLRNTQLKYLAYQQLCMLYSIFHNSEKALNSVDSMFHYLNKNELKTSQSERLKLSFTAAITYRMNSEYTLAEEQLAYCYQLHDSLGSSFNKRMYTMAESAVLYIHNKRYDEAEQILETITQSISPDNSYQPILHSMWGDLHLRQGRKQKAKFYFNKSLSTVSEQNQRVGLKVDLLKKLSNINRDLGNYQLALKQMTESKLLGDSLFGSKNAHNQQLFEIKDSYRLAFEAHQKIQRQQQVKILKAEKDKLNQRLTFTILLLAIIIIASIIVVRLIKHKHLAEKKLASERINAELKVKKKELAVTALQLIEKDKLLEEVKKGLEQLQGAKADSKVEQIKSTIRVNSAKTWDEFETRFVQVNSAFYETLGKKHPDLSRNDLKLCALIKLKFSSKEMAQLLGISSDSINKARYRLRKKLDLKRDDNLVQYINSF